MSLLHDGDRSTSAGPRIDVFINYAATSAGDARAARDLAVHLRGTGIEPWIAAEHLIPGERLSADQRFAAMEEAVAFIASVGGGRLGRAGLDEIVRAAERAARDPRFRVAPVLLPGGDPGEIAHLPEAFQRAPTFDLRDGFQDLRQLAEFLVGPDVILARRQATSDPPHPGRAEGHEEEAAAEPGVSASVRRATGDATEVSAAVIVRRLLEAHPEYGRGKARGLDVVDKRQHRRRSGRQWLAELRGLFDRDAVPILDGRLVICGLAVLERDLTKQLLDHDFLAHVQLELKAPLGALLSEAGRQRWEPDPVPTLADRPATVDRLGRTVFAANLAAMLDEERQSAPPGRAQAPPARERGHRGATDGSGHADSFVVHLHGPWGSGKSSLLGFLADALRSKSSRWVVVSFNAWQHERLGAPWWNLMSEVHRAGLREPFPPGWWRSRTWWQGCLARERWSDVWRSVRLFAYELIWRVRLGWMAYLLLPAVVGAIWLGWKGGFFRQAIGDERWLTELGAIAKPVGAILALIVTLLGAARGLSRSLSVGSARGATTFIANSRDPMRTLTRRYARIISTIQRPVAVFIDDLDRCQSAYVVDVLQGIQTLLIEAPVTYVVAADRRWLHDSFAKVYADFHSAAGEPGRPLGHLFLEKTFQLSAALPSPSRELRERYWRGLVRGDTGTDAAEEAQVRQEAKNRIGRRPTVNRLLEVAQTSGSLTANAEVATRDVAAGELATAAIQEEIEHRLAPFAPLLDPNPRAMKRLINSYRIDLGRLIVEGRRTGGIVTPEQLALWTIVSLRWPLIAEHAAKHPELLSGGDHDGAGRELLGLWTSREVQAVIKGRGVNGRLTEYAVRAIVGLDEGDDDASD